MTRRQRLLAVGTAGVALLGLLAGPRGYWLGVGLWRGERFYQGWPTSYWANQLQGWYPTWPEDGALPTDLGHVVWVYRASEWERRVARVKDYLARNRRSIGVETAGERPPLADGPAEAVGVLGELVRHEADNVRFIAALGLLRAGPAARGQEAALRAATADDDPLVQAAARAALDALTP